MTNAHQQIGRGDDQGQIKIVLKNSSGLFYFRLQITGKRG